jgi:hypothetical protein
MTAPDSKETPNINIERNSGQIAIGQHITQTQTINGQPVTITKADLEALNKMFTDLKAQVAALAPANQKEKALERVDELEEAVKTDHPDLTTMEYVKNWFGKNLPQLAGAVTSVVVNPIVGKLVEVAGEAITKEFRHRFGIE